MSGKVVAVIAGVAAVSAWYWASPWPVALAAVLIAIGALDLARSTARAGAVLALTVTPRRPMQMHWSFSVILTERAFDAMGFSAEHRHQFQESLGRYEPFSTNPFFDGGPAPEWISKPVTVSYERRGDSLERWTIGNSWIPVATAFGPLPGHHDKRVLEYLPLVDEAEIIHLWGDVGGLHLRYENGRIMLLNVDRNTSLMPDGTLYTTRDERILFNIPAPSLSMSRAERTRSKDPNSLDRHITLDDPSEEGFNPFPRYLRWHGKERFERADWDKGFRWDLEVNDLRPSLRARVIWVQRSLWRREARRILLVLVESGVRVIANPLVVEPASDGRALPKRGEFVWVVLGNEDERVDRMWLRCP